MKKLFLPLLVVCGLLATGCGSKDDRIVIYTSMEENRNQILAEMVKEKFPDYDVEVQQMGTGNSAAKIKTEGKNIEADIILGLELAHMENLKDNFADLSSYDDSHYVEGINPAHNKYFMWEKYTASVIINKTYFTEHNLTIPETYEDLLKEEYKGLIAMPDPKTSGTGYMYYLNVVNEMGEEEALKYFDNLSKNIKQFTSSGSGPINLLKQGEIAIAMGMTYQGAEEITNGANYEILELKTGTPYNYTAISIINGRETKTGIKEVFNWLITDFMAYDRENHVPGEIVKNQKNSVPNFPSNLKDANMTNIESMQTKENLTSKWKF